MDKATLEQGEGDGGSHWVKRTVAVTFCLGLIVALVMVFTRVIAARVPEQRATLEKLITDRTGLAVRFDNVHFAWDLDGMNAVFTRVELTDPKAGRVRVVAPELRVEFDSWDFLRHQQFSLGHVTVSSPDIEIIDDPEESAAGVATRRGRAQKPVATPIDERALMRRYLAWAELMPAGRIKVEGARVHLLRRGTSPGNGPARRSFTLSQAVVSRSNTSFNAHGTLLLSQDVGQSLFVSARLEGLGAGSKVSGELRLIARRVFLDKLPSSALSGRGTIDATFSLRDGLVHSGRWQASALELELQGDEHRRFDHLSVDGTLAREGHELLLDFSDLQLARGSRLERAPALNVRLALQAGTTQIERSMVRAERVPFMAAELITAILPSQPGKLLSATTGDWRPTAGELRDVKFDSGERHDPDAWQFSAQVASLELTRQPDGARLEQLAAQINCNARELTLRFDPSQVAGLHAGRMSEPRPLTLSGEMARTLSGTPSVWEFREFSASSESAVVSANGRWGPAAPQAEPLQLGLAELDRPLLLDAWTMLAADRPLPESLADIEQLHVVKASLQLTANVDSAVNWKRSDGAIEFAELVTAGRNMPPLSDARGAVMLTRGAARLELDSGSFEGFTVRNARIDWPRRGAPRLHATLDGRLDAALLHDQLVAQGLERLSGTLALEADASGERELRDPAQWRVSARVSDATMPLGDRLPAVEKLAGTIRYSAGQLRGLALAGNWLGGPVEVESRRASAGGGLGFTVNGVADAAPLLRLLGQEDVAQRVSGQFAWTGSAQANTGDGLWKVSFASNLSGVESRLPAPFDKARARAVPVDAQLAISRDGIREFAVASSRGLDIRGQLAAGVTTAHFEVQGVSGELRRSAKNATESHLTIKQLDLARAPQVLAAADALLPGDTELVVSVDDARTGARHLGALQATITQQEGGVAFSVESAATAVHQITAKGECPSDGRCSAEFSAATAHLAALLADARLPAEWPTASLNARGTLDWPVDAQGDFSRSAAGKFQIQTAGADDDHQLTASATLSDGQILLADLQGTGPAPDQVFRGNGRIGLTARDYDFTVDYERVSLAAAAVPSPARARLARAWNNLRGSVARRGWTEAPETRRVQWHGSWE
jgi:Protein of unknown function